MTNQSVIQPTNHVVYQSIKKTKNWINKWTNHIVKFDAAEPKAI